MTKSTTERLEALVDALADANGTGLARRDSKALMALVAELRASKRVIDRDEVAANLQERFAVFKEEHKFEVGQLVTWKPGCKNKLRPSYKEPAVVVEVLDPPAYDKEIGAGSAYYREPLDLVIGLIDEDDDFMFYHSDSRRFRPYDT